MPRKISSTVGVLFLFVLTQGLFSGCGYMALSRRTQFITPTEGVTISIAEKEDGPYTVITSDKNKIKLNHFKKGYFVKQEKEGHVSNTFELARTSKNGLKRLDIALLAPTAGIATIFLPIHFLAPARSSGQTPTTVQTALLFTALGVGIGGLATVIPAPGKLYPKKVELPKLIAIITKDTNQLFLTAGKHEFHLSKSGVRVHDYPSMKQFKNGYGYETRDTAENFEFVEKIKLHGDISTILKEAEYGIDSIAANNLNTLKVKSWTRSAVFMATEDKLRCELKTTWGLQTLDELQYLYDRTFSASTEWVDFPEDSLSSSAAQAIIREAFVDALGESFKLFVALDTVQSILSAPVPIPLAEEKELELSTGSVFGGSVSDAVKCVITVVTKDGHGSGCIVTPDGYVITNAHVVEDDTTELTAIMGDNVDKKIPLKFIRMNEAVDLALLKIDTTGLLPLRLCAENEIETGADVYAVGTPADVELGQTVTRGIISGKRKFEGHQRIQTDVGISPGNSGGALIDPKGVLLGIVTSQLRDRQVDNIGFAIPSPVIEEALKIKLNQ